MTREQVPDGQLFAMTFEAVLGKICLKRLVSESGFPGLTEKTGLKAVLGKNCPKRLSLTH
jgi:hypothetical protein